MEELEETLDVDVAALPQKATKVPQDPGETPIFRLLRLGLLQKAEVALRKLGQMPTGLAVNAREEKFEWGLLHFAAHKGELGLLDWLLRQKARPDMADGEGNTPLVLCAKSNHVQAMEMLMARGASIAQRTKEQGFTPLLWAASGGHQRAVKSLIEADADTECRDFEDRTALMWAARLGHLPVVRLLLRCGPDLTQRDKEGLTSLDHCREHLELRSSVVLAQEQCARLMDGAQREDIQLVSHLLEHDAIPRYKDAAGWTPLTWAVLHGSAEMARLLVRHGACPELLGEDSELGAQLAKKGRRVGVRLAAILGANTRLLQAAQDSDLAKAEEALQQGACPDAKQGKDGGGGGQAPREGNITAADREDEVIGGAEEAARCGEEPMGEGFGRNMTATMWSARHGNPDLVRLLGTQKADMNLRDSRGWTAVLWGSLKGDAETISVLHHFKADLLQRSWEGDSAVHLMVRCDHGAALQLLLAAKANVEEKSIQGDTPLHCAARHGSTSAMTVLLYFGAKMLTKDKLGRVAMLLAAAGLSPKAVEVLVSEQLEALPELGIELPEGDVEEVKQEPAQADRPAKERGRAGKLQPSQATASSPNLRSSVGGGTSRSRSSRKSGVQSMPKLRAGNMDFMAEEPDEGEGEPSVTSKDESSMAGSKAWPGSRQSSISEARRRPPEADSRRTSLRSVRKASVTSADASNEASSVSESMMSKDYPKAEVLPLLGQELWVLAAQKRRDKMSQPAIGPGKDRLQDTGEKGKTPLHIAVMAGQSIGHFRVLSKLVELRANTNARDRHNVTPLMQAAAETYTEAVERMLQEPSTKVGEQDHNGRTAADLAKSTALRMVLERAMVQERTGLQRKSIGFSERPQIRADGENDAVFRVRMEKLPTRMALEVLENKIQILLKKVVVKPVHMEVVMDPIMGRPRGHCYLDFLDSRSSDKAMELDGSELAGQRIRVFRDVALGMVR